MLIKVLLLGLFAKPPVEEGILTKAPPVEEGAQDSLSSSEDDTVA